METMRAFIAADIGAEIREKLDELQRKLKKVHANVRWVKPRSMHLTLVFLGDTPAEQIEPIKHILDQACHDRPAFDLEIGGTGYFGSQRHPRVVWAGVADCPPLMEQQARIVQRLNDAGIQFDDKPFSPHLTLGRIKGIDQHTGPLLEKIGNYQTRPLGTTRIDCMELIQSVLTPHGAEYTVLHRAAFTQT